MPEKRFHVGDHVTFRMWLRPINGIVKEDRGPIGVNGRRLYGIEFHYESDPTTPNYIELPAEEMELSKDEVAR